MYRLWRSAGDRMSDTRCCRRRMPSSTAPVFRCAPENKLEVIVGVEIDSEGIGALGNLYTGPHDVEFGIELADLLPEAVIEPVSQLLVSFCREITGFVPVERLVADRQLSCAFDGQRM